MPNISCTQWTGVNGLSWLLQSLLTRVLFYPLVSLIFAWKAVVVAQNSNVVLNFGPISVLPVFSKILCLIRSMLIFVNTICFLGKNSHHGYSTQDVLTLYRFGPDSFLSSIVGSVYWVSILGLYF